MNVLLLRLTSLISVKLISTAAEVRDPENNNKNTFLFPDDNKYIVLVLHRLGMANRLRAMADWFLLASQSKRTLLVSWTPSLECNCSFHDLFSDGPVGLKILPFSLPNNKNEGKLLLENILKTSNSSVALYGGTDFIVSPNLLLGANEQFLLTYYDSVVSLDGRPCQHYISKRSEFYRSLIPVKEAVDFVNNVRQRHFSDRMMIGVHMRVHDEKFDWSVVPPMGDSNRSRRKKRTAAVDHGEVGGSSGQDPSSALEFDEAATLEDFEGRMQTMQNFIDGGRKRLSSYDGNTSVSSFRFFIASNSDEAKQHLLARFPDSIVLSGDYRRFSQDGMYFALIEWLLLSEASFLLNTYGSSFAVEAAAVHMRPIVGLWDGKAAHHSNVLLPYCGHFQFLRAYAEQGKSVAYTEGTHDNRRVDGRMFSLQPCALFHEWGIGEVFCAVTDDKAEF